MKPKAKGRKPAPSVPAEPFFQAQLKDPEYAAEYIRQALEDDDLTYTLMSLRNVAEAYGGIGKLAKKAGLNRTQAYEILSEKGNPSLPKLKAILKALGFELTVKRAA
jgi:probable addiction module antidote protein